MAPVVRLNLIGKFAAIDGDGEPLTIPPTGARLLALLALHRHGLTRSCAGGMLWPTKDEQRASANLRSTLWRLKSTRSVTIIDREPASLCLSPGVRVDLDEAAEASCADDDLDRLFCDLLHGWSDPWVDPFRLRWRQTRLHAIDRRCRRMIDNEHYGQAVALASKVLTVEPLRESMVRLMVKAELALDRPCSAARAIERYQTRLSEEYAAQASSQVQDLAMALTLTPETVDLHS